MASSVDCQRVPHVALLPSAGMGHLLPCTRMAAALVEHGCEVSFIAIRPTVSSAEDRLLSDVFAAFPQIHPLHFRITPLDATSVDPFFLQFEAIRRSAHLLAPLLATSSPPLSALIIDISLASAYVPIAVSIGLPSYILGFSAMMTSLCAYFPSLDVNRSHASIGDVNIPGLPVIPKASIPSMLRDPAHLFTIQFVENGRALREADGILVNSCEALEAETLAALNRGDVVRGLPSVIPVGPLPPLRLQQSSPLPWLDAQPDGSVVYVCFGNRTAMSTDQIKEVGAGIEKSGCRFLWVIKTKKVDREEEDVELEELLGGGFLERVKERGMVVKGWVEQAEVLGHRAVGGFLSHCGWNSVTEAVLHGVRMLGWPLGGDQRVNAAVMRRCRLGIWVEEWGWEAAEQLVRAEDIAERVRELMENRSLRSSAEKAADAAARAINEGGSTEKALAGFIAKLQEF